MADARQVRPATPADAPELERIARAAYAPYRAAGIALPPVDSGLAGDIANGSVLVACDGARVLGFVVMAMDAGAAHLMNIAVDPAIKAQGVGRSLLSSVEAAATRAGARTISLTTHRDMPENVAMYRHLGWQVSGDEGDKVYMSRQLASKGE